MTTQNPRMNRGQLAPGVGDVTNRYSHNVVEYIVAQPANLQDRLRRAREELRHEEGVWRDPAITSSFASSAAAADSAASHDHYEAVTAGQAAGRTGLGSGQRVESWTDEDDFLDAFSAGSSGDQDRGSPPQYLPRAGANPRTLAPIALQRGERPTSIAIRQQAVPGRRPNEARAEY